MSDDVKERLPDSALEAIVRFASTRGEALPGVEYVRTTERLALQLALGYVPYPGSKAGLDDPVFLVSLRGTFYPRFGPASTRKRSGSFLRLIIDAESFQQRGLSAGDQPRDLSMLGTVLTA